MRQGKKGGTWARFLGSEGPTGGEKVTHKSRNEVEEGVHTLLKGEKKRRNPAEGKGKKRGGGNSKTKVGITKGEESWTVCITNLRHLGKRRKRRQSKTKKKRNSMRKRGKAERIGVHCKGRGTAD